MLHPLLSPPYELYDGNKTKGIVACDTEPRALVGNQEAWAEEIRFASGPLPEKITADDEVAMQSMHQPMSTRHLLSTVDIE